MRTIPSSATKAVTVPNSGRLIWIAQTARGKAEKKWDDLNVDNIEDNIDDRKATVEDRRQDLKDAQEDFDKYKDLDKDNSKRKDAEDDLERAQEDLNRSRAQS